MLQNDRFYFVKKGIDLILIADKLHKLIKTLNQCYMKAYRNVPIIIIWHKYTL